MALVKPWSLHHLASAAPGGRLLAAPRNQRCMRACASVVRHSHGDADAPTPECDHGDSSFAARFNASYGAVVGALVGDAAGAPAEFPVVGTLVSSLRHVMYAPLRVLGMQRGRALPSPRVLFSMPGHGARSQRQPTLGDVWAAVRTAWPITTTRSAGGRRPSALVGGRWAAAAPRMCRSGVARLGEYATSKTFTVT